MPFQIKDLKKLLRSIQQHDIDEVNINSKTFQLTINKSKTQANSAIFNSAPSKVNTNINLKKNNALTAQDTKENNINNISSNKTESYSTIVSPMVGTFYRSPAPNELAFVELYDIVQKRQTVCIIEAMKLMNEIEAEIYGEVVEILVQDGDIIDCGQALMRIKPISN